jgi:hypothetical protein
MHATGNRFNQVYPAQGGGVMKKKYLKTLTLAELTNEVAEMYFPKGRSATGMLLDDMSYYLATFTGEVVPGVMKNGAAFTVARYVIIQGPFVLWIYHKELIHFTELH